MSKVKEHSKRKSTSEYDNNKHHSEKTSSKHKTEPDTSESLPENNKKDKRQDSNMYKKQFEEEYRKCAEAKEELFQSFKEYINEDVVPHMDKYEVQNISDLKFKDLRELEMGKLMYIIYNLSGKDVDCIKFYTKKPRDVDWIKSKMIDYIKVHTCKNCRDMSHNIQRCPVPSTKYCNICHKKGHTPSQCYHRDQRPGNKFKK